MLTGLTSLAGELEALPHCTAPLGSSLNDRRQLHKTEEASYGVFIENTEVFSQQAQ